MTQDAGYKNITRPIRLGAFRSKGVIVTFWKLVIYVETMIVGMVQGRDTCVQTHSELQMFITKDRVRKIQNANCERAKILSHGDMKRKAIC